MILCSFCLNVSDDFIIYVRTIESTVNAHIHCIMYQQNIKENKLIHLLFKDVLNDIFELAIHF